ncbi:hypothetical protein ES703_19692 [subsurface metagenome]
MPKENEQKPQDQEAPATLEDMLKELPIPEKYKAVVQTLVAGILNSMVQINDRLAGLESKAPAAQDTPGAFEGLSAEQRYNILYARASAPAAEAQMQLYQGLLTGMRGGNSGGGGGGGDLATLAKSAESIQALRTILIPEASPLQVAMEKAQVSQLLAQTRLMNKVAGKATSNYLDKLESEIEGGVEGAT